MEGITRTALRCVGLLSMLVLSFASAPTSAPAPTPAPQVDSLVFPNSKTSSCAKKCALSCILTLEDPPNYVACFGLCMFACKIKPANSVNVAYGCTHNCVASVSKVMTSIANVSVSDLSSYAQGYVDSCFYSCSKKNKLI